ncbi:MAG: ribosome maturation factor RimP [Pseudomonadota bacterium]
MISSEIEALLEPAIERLGFELVDLEYQPGGGQSVLRVFIDGPNGITLDDCAAVSHQVSGILDVEDPIPGEYNLEISSPGVDRPLRRPAHFEKYAGEQVKIRMAKGFAGRRRLKGQLVGLEDNEVIVAVDEKTHRLPLGSIESARLVPDFDAGQQRLKERL